MALSGNNITYFTVVIVISSSSNFAIGASFSKVLGGVSIPHEQDQSEKITSIQPSVTPHSQH